MQQKNIEVLLPNIVKNVVSHSLGLDYNQTANLTSDTNLIKELGADSLDITDIVIQVQGKTGKILTPNQEAYLYEIIYDNPTIGTIINFIINPNVPTQIKAIKNLKQTTQEHTDKGKVITRIITNLKSNLFNKQTNISR